MAPLIWKCQKREQSSCKDKPDFLELELEDGDYFFITAHRAERVNELDDRFQSNSTGPPPVFASDTHE